MEDDLSTTSSVNVFSVNDLWFPMEEWRISLRENGVRTFFPLAPWAVGVETSGLNLHCLHASTAPSRGHFFAAAAEAMRRVLIS